MMTKALITAAAILTFTPTFAWAADVLEGATVVESATFTGESDHTVSGKVEIVKKGQYLRQVRI